MEKLTVICPCCEAAIVVDAATGAIISHEEKKRAIGSFEDLKNEAERQQDVRNSLFEQEMSSLKDRERLLEEKFREAFKKADKDPATPFKNPLDLD